MRDGFINCMHLTTMEERCYDKSSKIIKNTNYFCVDIMPDNLFRYSMLGGGASDGEICPNNEFIHTLENIGDEIKMTFPGGNMSCTKTLEVKCGAPAFRVLPESKAAVVYRVWWLEYNAANIETAKFEFTKNVLYADRLKSGHRAGMAQLGQTFEFTGLSSKLPQGYPGYVKPEKSSDGKDVAEGELTDK